MILVSAGHSNTDPGAVVAGQTEADYAVELRNLISDRLTVLGIPHLTDGGGSVNRPLTEAIKLAKTCEIAVEIHCNAAANPQAGGVECISLPEHKQLAQQLAAACAGVLHARLRGVGGWIDQTQSQHSRLGFVADGRGLILEVGFLTNPLELAAMQIYKALLARKIANILADQYRG